MLRGINSAVESLTTSTQAGTTFMFSFLTSGDQPYPVNNPDTDFIFAFHILPMILIVCTLSALL